MLYCVVLCSCSDRVVMCFVVLCCGVLSDVRLFRVVLCCVAKCFVAFFFIFFLCVCGGGCAVGLYRVMLVLSCVEVRFCLYDFLYVCVCY